MTETITRTPLWQMTDEQLRFLIEDELTPWDRRQTARQILHDRATERNNETAAAVETSEVTT